jgi:hypothetical protein
LCFRRNKPTPFKAPPQLPIGFIIRSFRFSGFLNRYVDASGRLKPPFSLRRPVKTPIPGETVSVPDSKGRKHPPRRPKRPSATAVGDNHA